MIEIEKPTGLFTQTVRDISEPSVIVRENCFGCPKLEQKMGEAALNYLQTGGISVVLCDDTVGVRNLINRSCKAAVELVKLSPSSPTDPFVYGEGQSTTFPQRIEIALESGLKLFPIKDISRT